MGVDAWGDVGQLNPGFIPWQALDLDYLVLDDDKTSDLPGSGTAIPSRGWSDDLCYGTGTMYLGGTSCMLLAINPVIHNSFRVHFQISPYQHILLYCTDHMP